jgi:hypothetical protein
MTDQDATGATPKPEDDDEDTPPPICSRCGAVITDVIMLRTKVVGRVISTQFRCVRCFERQSAIPQRP